MNYFQSKYPLRQQPSSPIQFRISFMKPRNHQQPRHSTSARSPPGRGFAIVIIIWLLCSLGALLLLNSGVHKALAIAFAFLCPAAVIGAGSMIYIYLHVRPPLVQRGNPSETPVTTSGDTFGKVESFEDCSLEQPACACTATYDCREAKKGH